MGEGYTERNHCPWVEMVFGHMWWSRERVLWIPERNLMTRQGRRGVGLSRCPLKEMGAYWVPSTCHLLGRLLHRTADSQSILSALCRGWERGMSGNKSPSDSWRKDRNPSHPCGQHCAHTMSPSLSWPRMNFPDALSPVSPPQGIHWSPPCVSYEGVANHYRTVA